MSDELDPLITRCPNCDTRFRVNETQLQAALGQVRCGACLTVFDGTSYLLSDGELISGEAEDVDALLTEIDAQEQSLDHPTDEPEFAPAPATEVEPMVAELADRVETADMELEELEAQLLAELRGESVPQRRVAAAAGENAVAADAQPSSPYQPAPAALPLSTEQGEATATEQSEDPVDEALDDLLAANQAQGGVLPPKAAEPARGRVSEPTEEPAEEPVTEADDARDEDDEPFAQNIDAEPDLLDEQPWLANERSSTQIPHVDIPPELLEDEPVKRTWPTWTLLVLAVIALPAQVLWYQFEDWSKDTTLRPIYVQACAVFGCELPVQRNVGLIIARNSVLRDHPEVADALIYDALLINQAEFKQPFPLVELTLTTIGGHLVASRRFKPTEYLSGEVGPDQTMVPDTPVHISLAIKDPGEAPLNFRVRFLPFDQR